MADNQKSQKQGGQGERQNDRDQDQQSGQTSGQSKQERGAGQSGERGQGNKRSQNK